MDRPFAKWAVMTIPVRKGALVCGGVNVVCDAVGIVWCGGVWCVVCGVVGCSGCTVWLDLADSWLQSLYSSGMQYAVYF